MKSRGSISTDSKDSFDSSMERTTYRVVVLGKSIVPGRNRRIITEEKAKVVAAV